MGALPDLQDAVLGDGMAGSGRLNENAPLPRGYQLEIAKSVLAKGSTLVVLPTGLGKTLIAFLVAQEKLQDGPVLFCAPTKPLAMQHEREARKLFGLEEGEIVLATGAMNAKRRAEAYPGAGKPVRMVFSTPQTIRNDLAKGLLKWNFSLLVLDEVHRTVGKYAYTEVAKAAREGGSLILGLTASPGAQKKKIEEMTGLLGIGNVEIRSLDDEDVAKYAQGMSMKFIEVELTQEMGSAKEALREMIGEKMVTLRKMGFPMHFSSKREMVAMRMKILASQSPLRFSALSNHAMLFSLSHCLELLETQGVKTLLNFVEKIKLRKESKAQQRLLHDARFVRVVERMKSAGEHPKMERLLGLLAQKRAQTPSLKAIVFCQYRDTATLLAKMISEKGIPAQAFMGKKDGVTAQGQRETLDKFRAGAYDVLVATSIGEEGLDIPSVDIVVFYEPVPSEIRSIQRRGRAGRAKVGEVYVLVTRGTQDQGFFFASRKREEKMRRIVGKMAGKEYAAPKSVYERVDEGRADKETHASRGGKTPAPNAEMKKNAGAKERKKGAIERQTKMSEFTE